MAISEIRVGCLGPTIVFRYISLRDADGSVSQISTVTRYTPIA